MRLIFCDSPNLAMSTPWSIRIGMPFWALSNAERAAVLLHELAHHRFRHSWRHMAYAFVWWLAPGYFTLRVKEHEHEADAFVVMQGFGAALLQLLARHVGAEPGPLHPSAQERIARVKRLMDNVTPLKAHGKR